MNLLGWIPVVLIALIYLLVLIRFIRNRAGKEIRKKATVLDKYETMQERVSNVSAPTRTPLYVVAFDVKDKVLKFKVPGYQYGTIEKGDAGILVYKGTRFIRFETATE